jgi:hypothetical protein
MLSCAPAYAQGATGEIWGQVNAVTGEVIERATITVTNIDTGADRETRTDSHGRFGVAELPAGRYRATAVHEGFAGRRQDDIVLLPGQRMQLVLPLRRAPLSETISLNPYPPIAETARTHVSAPVGETELHELPVPDRQYLRLTGLAPHVADDATTGGVSVMNLPSTQNRLVIDGMDHTSGITGEPVGGEGMLRVPYEVSYASIAAMRVHVSGAPADTGGAAGGIFDVVTRSGANAFHGSAYEFFGDRALNTRTTLQDKAGLPRPAYRNNQFGGVLGGALTKERNFFLVSYDRLARTAGSPAVLDVNVLGSVDSRVTGMLNDARATAPRDHQQDAFLARTDHTYGGQHVMLRYGDQAFEGSPVDGALLQPALTSAGTSTMRNRSAAAALSMVFGPAFTNELRTQVARNRDVETRNPTGAGYLVWQGATFIGQSGASSYGPHAFGTRRFQIGDAISWVSGPHAVKIGGDVLRDRDAVAFGQRSTWMYMVGPGLPLNAAETSTGTFGALSLRATNTTQYAAFAQDAWRATSALTLDLGLRYDRQDLQRVNDRGGWAPRVGFAYSPGGRGKTLRGSYGVFYGSTPALIPAMAAAFGLTRPLGPDAVVVDPSFRQPHVQQAAIGAEFEKYRAGSVGLQYVFAHGERLPRAVDTNTGHQILLNPYRVVSFQSDAESIYNGISVSLRTRVLNQLFFRGAYTVGRSDETPQQPLGMVFEGSNDRRSLAQGDLLNRRAPGNNDAHQRLDAGAAWDTRLAAMNRQGLAKTLLDDWMFAVVYTWQTSYPYTAFVAGDQNGDQNWLNDVAPGTKWNQYRLPYRGSFDPRATRRFDIGRTRQLELIWEAFNVTNRPNYTAADNTMYAVSCLDQPRFPCTPELVSNPRFGRKTAQANGRMMQLAARFTF